MSFCSLIKATAPKIRTMCFVLINSVPLNLLCVWIWLKRTLIFHEIFVSHCSVKIDVLSNDVCVCLDNNAWLQNILTSNRLCQFIVRLSVTTVPSKTWGVSLYPGKAKEPSVILAKPQLTCKVEAFAELKTAAVSILRARFACPLVLKEGRGRGAQEESRHNSLLIIFPPDLSRFCVPPPLLPLPRDPLPLSAVPVLASIAIPLFGEAFVPSQFPSLLFHFDLFSLSLFLSHK